MHLNEGVELSAQEPLVFSRGHAVEQLEQQLLLLGGRGKRFRLLLLLRLRHDGQGKGQGWVRWKDWG